MVRSFSIQNGWPSLATRKCAMKGERLDSAATATAGARLFARGRAYGYLKPLLRAEFLREHALSYDPRLRIGEDFQLIAEMLAHEAVYLRRRSADR